MHPKTRLFLIRHCETFWNAERRFQGLKESRLTPLGEKQAFSLKKRFENEKIDFVFSSPAERAKKTARIAFPNHEIKINDFLHERCYGEWEGCLLEEIKNSEKHKENYLKYLESNDLNVTGCEKLDSFLQRTGKVFNEILDGNRGKNLAIVSHGILNSAIISMIKGIPRKKAKAFITGNSGVTEIEHFKDCEKSVFKILSVGDVSHLTE